MSTGFICSLCGNGRHKNIPFRYLFRERYIYATRCTKCKLIVLYPPPNDEEISEMYSEDYFTVEDVQTHHYKKDYMSAVEAIDYTPQVERLKHYLPDNGHILEVGCASGELLNALRREGYQVAGVEISDFAGKVAIEKYDLNVIIASFEEENTGEFLQESSFDLILMGDVLEHMRNPSEAMRYALRLLKPGGKLVVHVPSTLNLISSRLAFMLYRIIGSQKTMTIPPYHLTEFFPATLRRMFLTAGFSTCSVIQETKHPKTIALRHSRLENMIKLIAQYPNYFLTRWLGIYGDRLTGIGIK